MYPINIKAYNLFEKGKKEEVVEYLQSVISKGELKKDVLLFTLEQLVDYKSACFESVDLLLLKLEKEFDAEDLSGHILLRLCSYYHESNEKEKARMYFQCFENKVSQCEEYCSLYGIGNLYNKLAPLYKSLKDANDLYERCDFGANMAVLNVVQTKYILCDAFVSYVNFGGFEEYFSTDFSPYCKETVKYLKEIGSKVYPQALNEAIDVFGKNFDFSFSGVTGNYIEENEKIREKLEKIEMTIYESDEDIESLLLKLKELI